jgi:hypothetical protein
MVFTAGAETLHNFPTRRKDEDEDYNMFYR